MEEGLIATRNAKGLAALAAGLLLLAGPAIAQGQPPAPARPAAAPSSLVGAWDIEKVGASRSCTVTFGSEAAAKGWQLRFPATCRRALPILNDAVGWDLGPAGVPRLVDGAGKVLVAFDEKASGAGRRGKGGDGAQYGLDPKGHPRVAARPAPSAAEQAATAATRRTAVDPAQAPAPETVAGRYGVMRQPGREVCKLALTATPSETAGATVASFEGSCADTGLTIFSPVAWRYAAGRLELIARKGHKVELVFEDGQWRKDPAVGAPLLLKKLP
ncbi:AprI/Inh family metalloprotease inhibitor [Bosea rubneri]|uniref:AprI/Inh family metalloprotease inhibitor n=1 Tax=Bosea rubneri TaxID=3075434 RepID=A0ABU3S914_9HYPH|nr:AprI/Inh family metalloprotease inhibitor [Bosea sp. ZW T0_25]MDU0341239.1 AprI/Inh family metalloprotease inhibitor [Bosea sp. ZW T0_25]